MRADDLLAGPRGRRLCAELVRGSNLSSVPAASDVARRLDAVLSGPDPDAAIFAALSDSVYAARYWQDPDEDDVELADAQLQQTLRPVADALARHPSTQWWWTGLDSADQVFTMTDRTGPPPTIGTPSTGTLTDLRAETVESNERMRQHRLDDGEDVWSMTSAQWWSPPLWAAPSTARRHPRFGPVELSLEEDAPFYDDARSWPVVLPENPRVLDLDSATAWADLVLRYPLDVTFARGANWLQATGRDGAWALPDWAAAAADHDAVHLPVATYLSASGRVIDVDDTTATFIAAWGPDQTYWLTDIDLVDAEPTVWTRGRGERWRPLDNPPSA